MTFKMFSSRMMDQVVHMYMCVWGLTMWKICDYGLDFKAALNSAL